MCDRLRECNGVMMDLIEMGDNSWAYLWPYWAILGWSAQSGKCGGVRACWGQTTIKRSSDFTHMMIIKIVVRVKYGKWYWNPDTVFIYLTTLQLLIFTLAQTISNSNSNIHEQLSAIKWIKMDWISKSFFNWYLIFFTKWKAWNIRKIFWRKLCAILSDTWLSKIGRLNYLKVK